MIKRYAFGAIVLLGLSACKPKATEQPLQHFGAEPYDSAALHLALLANHDCLPLIYAERTGIYDSLGLRLQIAVYHSQMDCDTALMNPMVDGGMADSVRMKHYGKRMVGLSTQWKGSNRWQLMVSGNLRVKDVKGLDGRTVAVARQSAENTLLDDNLKAAGLKKESVYRPQVNDLKLRADMLGDHQVDATLTCWPYTSLALSQGCGLVHMSVTTPVATHFVMRNSSMEREEVKKQWELLEKGRKMAIDSLRLRGPQAYSLILQKDYRLPAEVADTVRF